MNSERSSTPPAVVPGPSQSHPTNPSSSSNQNQQQQQQQAQNQTSILLRWQHLVSCAANSMHKAEKAGENSTQQNCRELEESVVTFLKKRIEFHRVLGNVEAKLQGKAQEREALEGYVRTQPRLGKRKRHQEQQTAAELQSAILNVANQTATTWVTENEGPALVIL